MPDRPTGVDVDTDPLRSAASSYTSAAGAIRRVGLNFGNITATYAYAFGNDSPGREVHAIFSTLATGCLDGLHTYARAVDSTADGITGMARQYERAEDRNTRVATHLGNGGPDDPTTPGPGDHPATGGPGPGGSGPGGSGRGRH